jgi:ATP-dependent Clp protease protease subunit
MIWKKKIDKNIKEVELRTPPAIIRVNKFNEASAKEFAARIAQAQNTGQKVIPVVIDSYGGEVYSLMSMIASIKSSKLPVATIVEGKAMSCGVILFSCGTKGYRYITEDATLMIHDVSSGARGKNSKILAGNSNKTEKWFEKKITKRGRSDWFLDPEKAIELGLADHVGMPKLQIKVKLDIDLV